MSGILFDMGFTYILTNNHHTVLYVGSTTELKKRIYLHRKRLIPGFTKKSHFIRTHSIKKSKILSLHCLAAVCIRKGKVGKENEFGRVFQLGRIGGNFLVTFSCTDLHMNDKRSFIPALKEHAGIFGQGRLQSIATDKGYYAKANIVYCESNGLKTSGIQRPGNIKASMEPELALSLRNRRAGIEPLIGHVKEFGLRKSKMRSDRATLSSGYRSVTGFNLHQMTRRLAKIA